MNEISRTFGAVAAFARLGWREAGADRFGLTGRLLLFTLPVLIFNAIWQATPLAGGAHDAAHLTWYVMMTEVIVFAPGFPFREVEEDIRSGAIEAALSRPLAYVLARVAEEAGGTLLRLFLVGSLGTAIAWLATGIVPVPLAAVPVLVLAAALGALLIVLCQVVIGFCAAWMGTPAPIYWIWQKMVFVLGGLFMPLTLYPGWLHDIGVTTPFAAILFHPASLVLETPGVTAAAVFAWQGVWLAVALLLVSGIAAAATRRFVREGV